WGSLSSLARRAPSASELRGRDVYERHDSGLSGGGLNRHFHVALTDQAGVDHGLGVGDHRLGVRLVLRVGVAVRVAALQPEDRVVDVDHRPAPEGGHPGAWDEVDADLGGVDGGAHGELRAAGQPAVRDVDARTGTGRRRSLRLAWHQSLSGKRISWWLLSGCVTA